MEAVAIEHGAYLIRILSKSSTENVDFNHLHSNLVSLHHCVLLLGKDAEIFDQSVKSNIIAKLISFYAISGGNLSVKRLCALLICSLADINDDMLLMLGNSLEKVGFPC